MAVIATTVVQIDSTARADNLARWVGQWPGTEITQMLVVSPSPGEPFNKSALMNRAFQRLNDDTIWFVDVDCVLSSTQRAFALSALETHEIVWPFDGTVDYVDADGTLLRRYDYPEYPTPGGAWVARPGVVRALGGMCEDFTHYGLEDCEFFERVRTLGVRWTRGHDPLRHYEHPRATAWHEDPQRATSLARYDNLCAAPREELLRRIARYPWRW